MENKRKKLRTFLHIKFMLNSTQQKPQQITEPDGRVGRAD